MASLAVARLVRREILRRPLHVALVLAAATLILLARALAAFGFGQEDALVLVGGLETVAIYGFAAAILFGAGSVGRDIEGRLLVSVLARPVGRGSYLLGRFLGLVETVLVGTVALAFVLALVLAFTARDGLTSSDVPAILGSLCLMAAQTAALVAAVLALSVLAPPSLGLVLASLVAAGGLLAEPVRQGLPADASPVVTGIARILSLLLPPLARPGEATEVAFGGRLPLDRLAVGVLRALVYAGAALSLGAWRLGRKDLT